MWHLVALAMLGEQLGSVVSAGFSNLNDSVIHPWLQRTLLSPAGSSSTRMPPGGMCVLWYLCLCQDGHGTCVRWLLLQPGRRRSLELVHSS